MSTRRIQRRPPGEVAALAGLDPLLARLYGARGVRTPDELVHSLDALEPLDALGSLDAASDLLMSAMAAGQTILVVGDYDADGATATALAVLGLRRLGAPRVEHLVPDRRIHGYGLTPEIVTLAAARAPGLLVTVDNGIASHAGVAAARALGMRVLVTDHHLPGPTLPAADAIVDPNLAGDAFPSKALAGVGVMFYVLLALRRALRARGWFSAARPEPNLAELLDLVALGTVADVAVLDRNNRVLVAQGLARLRAGRARPGLLALADAAGRARAELSAQDLGFALGPRLNAAGRLDDMSVGVELLLTDDPARARELAALLDGLNRERKLVEADMQGEAESLVAALGSDVPFGLCLHDPDWHPGVVGLVASRVKERLHRPVIAFATGSDGVLKGSARSVPGLHVRDVLEAIATRTPGLIQRFGGHAMAAGLSLEAQHLPAFRLAFDVAVRERLDPAALEGVVWTDGGLEPARHDAATATLLRAAGPWGQGFPEPVFDARFAVREARVVADRHLKLRLALDGQPRLLDAIWFGGLAEAGGALPAPGTRVELAYQLELDGYRGGDAVQLMVRHCTPV
jgi:single-stranded-DNA-specific exonuclease